MGINSQSDIAANLQIGPTDQGMVRIYLQGEGIDLPLDFDPEEAAEIAEELLAAARTGQPRFGRHALDFGAIGIGADQAGAGGKQF